MRFRKGPKSEPGLRSTAPIEGRFRIAEEISGLWLGVVGVTGALLVSLGLALDLAWKVDNILPTACLSVGVGVVLFAVLFGAERRIVRRVNLVWISRWDAIAEVVSQDASELRAHFEGPVAAVRGFVGSVLDGDYESAWLLADENWRLCRAQAWIWNNQQHPLVAPFDEESTAAALADEYPSHALWAPFAETELDRLCDAWGEPDLRAFGAASRPRRVADGEIVLLIDLTDHPHGAMVEAPTRVEGGVPFLVRQIGDTWRVANLVGDRLPQPGWPPDWREGFTYWDEYLD